MLELRDQTLYGDDAPRDQRRMRCPSCHHLNPDDVPSCRRCGASLGQPSTEPAARIADRYRLGPLLGEGAMARVFRADDEVLGRTVALKMLARELCESPRARERMAREAAALGRVTHPNVVGIYNVFEHEGAIVLELEYASGGTLRDRLESGPLTLDEALGVMGGILAGLCAIHAAGIIHRDLKPSNILLAADGTPKIGDLGVARDTAAVALTATGTALGTAEYMSPEQVRGEAPGPTTDIYACGVILHELLSGRVPFRADSEFEVMRAHLTAAPDLVPLQHRAPPLVVHAVARALAKAPEQRWGSARELAEVLARPSSRSLPSGAFDRVRGASQPEVRERPAERLRAPGAGERRSRGRRSARRRVDPPGPGTLVASLGARSRRSGWLWVALVMGAAAIAVAVLLVLAAVVGTFGLDLGRGVRQWYFGPP